MYDFQYITQNACILKALKDKELISYHLEKIHTVDRHHTTETIIFQGGYGWTMYGG